MESGGWNGQAANGSRSDGVLGVYAVGNPLIPALRSASARPAHGLASVLDGGEHLEGTDEREDHHENRSGGESPGAEPEHSENDTGVNGDVVMAAEERHGHGGSAKRGARDGAMSAPHPREKEKDYGKPDSAQQELRRGGVSHEPREGVNRGTENGGDDRRSEVAA